MSLPPPAKLTRNGVLVMIIFERIYGVVIDILQEKDYDLFSTPYA